MHQSHGENARHQVSDAADVARLQRLLVDANDHRAPGELQVEAVGYLRDDPLDHLRGLTLARIDVELQGARSLLARHRLADGLSQALGDDDHRGDVAPLHGCLLVVEGAGLQAEDRDGCEGLVNLRRNSRAVLVDEADGDLAVSAAREEDAEQQHEHDREEESPEERRPIPDQALHVRDGKPQESVHRSSPSPAALDR